MKEQAPHVPARFSRLEQGSKARDAQFEAFGQALKFREKVVPFSQPKTPVQDKAVPKREVAWRTGTAAGIAAASLAGGALPIENPIQDLVGTKKVEAAGAVQDNYQGYTLSKLSEPQKWGEQKHLPRVAEADPRQLGEDFPLRPPDQPVSDDIPEGWFFTQTRGADKPAGTGFIVYNQDNAPMYDIFEQYRTFLGYPITDSYTDKDGKVKQLFQTAGIEYNPATGERGLVNSLDIVGSAGIDLNRMWYRVPNNWPWNVDQHPDLDTRHLPWAHNDQGPLPGSKEEVHVREVFSKRGMPTATDQQIQSLKDAYFSYPDWFERFGLPLAAATYTDEIGGVIHSVRLQRATIQWREKPRPGTDDTGRGPIIMYASQILKDLSVAHPGLVPAEAREAKYNPFGVGGPVTFEGMIQRSAVTDSVTATSNGKQVTVEMRVPTNNGAGKVALKPETKQQLVNLVAKDGEKNGFTNASVIILRSPDQAPQGMELKQSQINLDAYKGSGGWYTIGEFGSMRVGDKVTLVFVPAPNLSKDPDILRGVSEAITRRFMFNTNSGGDYQAAIDLSRQPDRLNLVNQQALNFS